MRQVFLFIGIVLVTACSENKSALQTLDNAEALMTTRPDSALNLVRTIDAKSLRRRATKARYALAYSQALDKNRIDLESDTLIQPAVQYYTGHGSPEARLQTQYYLGRVQENSRQHLLALQTFLQATEMPAMQKDHYLAGLVYSSLARINQMQGNYKQAQHYSRQAFDAYNRGGKARHQIDALASMGQIHYLHERYDSARIYHTKALEMARAYDLRGLEIYGLRNLALICLETGDIAGAKDHMYRIMAKSRFLDKNDFVVFCRIHMEAGQLDSAAYYADRIVPEQTESGTPLVKLLLQSKIAAREKRFEQAFRLSDESRQINDSIFMAHMNNSGTLAELQFKNERLAHERYRLAIKQRTIYGIVGGSILLLGAIVLFFQRRYRRQNRQMAEYLSVIDNMSASAPVHQMEINKLFMARFALLKDLAKTYYEYGNSPALIRRVQEILSDKILDKSVMEDLEQTLNNQYNNVIQQFREAYPRSGNDVIELLCLNYAGFSPQEICVITNETLPAIYMRKSRLRKRISTSTLENKEEILKILE